MNSNRLMSSPDWDFAITLLFSMLVEHGKQRDGFESRAIWSQ